MPCGIDQARADEGDVEPSVAQAAHHVARAALLQPEGNVGPLGAELADRAGDQRMERRGGGEADGDAADLADETFILYRRPDGRGLYDVIVSACAEAGFSPHVDQEAPRIVSTLNLVAAGLGITIVPASLSRLPLEGVTYRPLTGRPAIKVPLNLACRSDERSAATLGFIELVRRLS